MARFTGTIVYLCAIVTILFSGCANQQPPGGGEVDRIPPKILEIFPANGAVNYKENYIEVTFSKYVDKRSFKDGIFISPALEGNPKIEWSGKTARINFPSELRKNTTYVITVGTDVVDLNNRNRLAEAFNLYFSTGSQIDKRCISGKVYSEKPEGIMIFCYNYKDSVVSLLKRKPDFLSQVGTNGMFTLNGLAAGKYIIFAVKDEYRSPVFNADQDMIGIPPYPVTLKQDDTLFSDLNFSITKYDSIRPRILNAVMTDKNHLILSYSEPLDSGYLKSDNYYIIDSTSKAKQPVSYVYKTGKPTESVLSFKGGFAEGDQVFLFADTLKDKAENFTIKEYASFTVSTKPDTLKPFIRTFMPEPKNEFVAFLYPEFKFLLNKGVDTSLAKKGISFSDTLGQKVDFSVLFTDNSEFRIKANQQLDANKYYQIVFNYNHFVDLSGNKLDSVYQYRFKTKNGLDFTGVSGTVLNFDSTKNPILVLQSMESQDKKYSKKLSPDGKFSFDKIDAGKYSLMCYYDINNNGEYDAGKVVPFTYSEEFFYYSKAIQLRPRWQITDVVFKLH